MNTLSNMSNDELISLILICCSISAVLTYLIFSLAEIMREEDETQ